MNRFDVIFDGDLVEGSDLDDVKLRMAGVLKTDPKTVDRLFGGRSVLIKRGADRQTAEKIVASLEGAGARCRMISPEDSADMGPPEGFGDHPLPLVKEASADRENGFIQTNVETVPGKQIIEHFGLVSGSTIRAKNIGRDFMASLKNIVGGELKGYTQLLQESRRQAMERMIDQARQLGANAVVNVRFSTSSVAQGAAELYAYGTAVRVK
jgi:uncharacterized protein YbjQ (UPF0145 family)